MWFDEKVGEYQQSTILKIFDPELVPLYGNKDGNSKNTDFTITDVVRRVWVDVFPDKNIMRLYNEGKLTNQGVSRDWSWIEKSDIEKYRIDRNVVNA